MSIFRFFNLCTNNLLGYRNIFRSRIILKYEEQQASISSKILKKLGIPPRPKKPLNIYIKFSQIIRPKLLEKQPDISMKDLSTAISNEWNKLDPIQKNVMQEEYNLLKEKYLLKIKNYNESITKEQHNLIKRIKTERKTKILEKIHKKKLSLGIPKKPLSTFLMFVMEKKNQKHNIKQTEWIKLLSQEWKNISESDKEKYKRQFKLELDKYKSELVTWQENMIRQGYTDIVQTKNILHVAFDKPKLNKTDV